MESLSRAGRLPLSLIVKNDFLSSGWSRNRKGRDYPAFQLGAQLR
jgi:hypothetical protein